MASKIFTEDAISSSINRETNNMIDEFEKAIIKSLNYLCHQGRATKNYTKECVILKDDERIQINSTRVWSSRIYARKAIQKIIDGEHYVLDPDIIWKYRIRMASKPSFGLRKTAREIRLKWADEHLRIMPLKDFILSKYDEDKSNDKR